MSIYHLSGAKKVKTKQHQLDPPDFKYNLPIIHSMTTAPNGQGQLHLLGSDTGFSAQSLNNSGDTHDLKLDESITVFFLMNHSPSGYEDL